MSAVGPQVTVKKWSAVCFWSVGQDNQSACGICKNSLMLPCIACEAEVGANQSGCSVCVGACNHAFHHHCITKFFNRGHSKCPFDNDEFQVVKFVDHSSQ